MKPFTEHGQSVGGAIVQTYKADDRHADGDTIYCYIEYRREHLQAIPIVTAAFMYRPLVGDGGLCGAMIPDSWVQTWEVGGCRRTTIEHADIFHLMWVHVVCADILEWLHAI